MKHKTIQIGITVGALLVALVHVVFPDLKIDGVTLALLILAAVPWLAPLFKSLEFPGGWKLEFHDLQKAEERAGEAGLLAEPTETPDYSFQIVADEDPNLALAGLRIELEKRLQELAEARDVQVRRTSVGRLLRLLGEREILSVYERSVLEDLVGLLNAAVHGADVDNRSAEWAMDVGPRLLQALENKL